jgi:hypothetical protein
VTPRSRSVSIKTPIELIVLPNVKFPERKVSAPSIHHPHAARMLTRCPAPSRHRLWVALRPWWDDPIPQLLSAESILDGVVLILDLSRVHTCVGQTEQRRERGSRRGWVHNFVPLF